MKYAIRIQCMAAVETTVEIDAPSKRAAKIKALEIAPAIDDSEWNIIEDFVNGHQAWIAEAERKQ